MKIMKGAVHLHYNFYSGSEFPLRENDFDPFRGVDCHPIQRPRISQNRRMLQNHQRIVLSPHQRLGIYRFENEHRRESPDRRDSPLRERPRGRQSPYRQEILQQFETLHLSEPSQRSESPQRNNNWNPFLDPASSFERYRSNQSPLRSNSINRERSLTPLIRQSPRRSYDEREYTPNRHYRRPSTYRSHLNPFRRSSVSRERSLTPLIRQSPRRSDDEREQSRTRRQYTPTRHYRRHKTYRCYTNPFRRNSVSRERSLTPLIRQSSRQDDEREQSITRRQYTPPRRQMNVSRNVRLLIRRPHKSQLSAYSRKINKLRILRRSASRALFQSLTGEIRALTKLSRAVRGLPLNRQKFKKRTTQRRHERVQYTQETADEACLNEPDAFEFLD